MSSYASSPEVRVRMQRQRRRDTAPEMRLRRLLHRAGLRYRVHARPLDGLRREADVVFRRARVAVFVDGCFWHGCDAHGKARPVANGEYWRAKIAANRDRDRDTDERLAAAGWASVRVWEHEDMEVAAGRLEALVRSRHGR